MQQNSYGFKININTQRNLTNATDIVVSLSKPSGIKVKRALNITTDVIDATLGIISFKVAKGDIDEAGAYSIQVADQTGDIALLSEVKEFEVYKSIYKPN